MKNIKDIIKITKPLKILYVEDNAEARESTLIMLDNLFDNIIVGTNGLDGLELYKKQYKTTDKYFDIVISDIEMPKMSGIDMVKAIYKINNTQKVLITSAYTDKKYLVPLLNIGVEGFINKPLDFKQVNEIITKICLKFINNNKIELIDGYVYDKLSKKLILNDEQIELNKNEIKLIELFLDNTANNFSSLDIFSHLFYDNPIKEYSADSIRSLMKRFRKKIPENLIIHDRTIGYKINLS